MLQNKYFLEEMLYENSNLPVVAFLSQYSSSKHPSFPLHWHSDLELFRVVAGKARVTMNFEPFHVSPGDIIVVSPNMLHSVTMLGDEDFLCKLVRFNLQLFKDPFNPQIMQAYTTPFEEEKLVFVPLIRPEDDIYESVCYSIDRILSFGNATTPAASFFIKSEVTNIYANLLTGYFSANYLPEKFQYSTKIKEVLCYIGASYSQEITLQNLADFAGYSKYHFARFFKERTGMTCTEYITHLRLLKAAELLVTTEQPIGLICDSVHILSVSYLSKLFKIRYGLTPFQFRKRQHSA